MQNFPKYNQPLFHVPSQKPCIALGGCVNSKLVTTRFDNGAVLSIRMAELVPNEPLYRQCCRSTAKPERDGVCKSCRVPFCPVCGKCNCSNKDF